MRVSKHVECKEFPCADVRCGCYVVPDIDVKPGVPLEVILEFVKLSDLARIPGLKTIRTRLCDAGVDTIERLLEVRS